VTAPTPDSYTPDDTGTPIPFQTLADGVDRIATSGVVVHRVPGSNRSYRQRLGQDDVTYRLPLYFASVADYQQLEAARNGLGTLVWLFGTEAVLLEEVRFDSWTQQGEVFATATFRTTGGG
jgi:hypothetical protein